MRIFRQILVLFLQRTQVLILQRTQVLILHWLQPRAPTITTTTPAMKMMTFSLGSRQLPLWCRRHRRVHLLFPLLDPLLVPLLVLLLI